MASRKPSYLSLTDLFCGAGGASIGAEAAGCKLVLGVNHWQQAIETHSTNFPGADHDCRDVSETHPSRYRSTHLLWASPECPKWSQARGRRRDQGITGQLGLTDEDERLPTEAEERSRVTMWDVVRYTEYHEYDAVVVENVVDVVPWVLLPTWYAAMETLGYAHRTLFVNSMMFGAPQSRDRWYAVFWKRGNRTPDLELTPPAWCPRCEARVEGRQSFKKTKRWTDRYGAQYLYLCPTCAGPVLPYVLPALSAIDLSDRGSRFGDKKRAAATRARVQAGIDKFWVRPVVFDVMRDPKHRDVLEQPLPTQTGRQSLALYLPLVTALRGTQGSQIASSARPADEPMRTISAEGTHHGLVTPPLYVKMNGGVAAAGPMAHPVTDPLGSLTAKGHVALVTPAGGTWRRDATTVLDPLPTRTSVETDGVVMPPLQVQAAGNTYERAPGSCRIRPAGLHPLWTQPGTEQTAIVTEPRPFLSTYYGNGATRPIDDPMPTCRGKDSHSLVSGPAINADDCFFRMLRPDEIGLGMAFPSEYVVTGTSQRVKVRQYGLAVTPPVATWIWQRVIKSLEGSRG